MSRSIKYIAIVLIGGHLLAEAHSFLRYCSPKLADTNVSWFWTNVGFELSIQWWLKMTCEDLLLILTFYCAAKIAQIFSRRLYLILMVFFFYHCIDIMLFFWNYKQTVWVYWSLLAAVIVGIILLFIPVKEKAKVISME